MPQVATQTSLSHLGCCTFTPCPLFRFTSQASWRGNDRVLLLAYSSVRKPAPWKKKQRKRRKKFPFFTLTMQSRDPLKPPTGLNMHALTVVPGENRPWSPPPYSQSHLPSTFIIPRPLFQELPMYRKRKSFSAPLYEANHWAIVVWHWHQRDV